jgi:adenosylcobinamide-GDP ribazoletransferase
VASTLTLLASVYLTGAFHEDGLADTADGLGGSHSKKKLLEIMKDSRIGTYGACALVLSLLLRASLLVELASFSLRDVYGIWIMVHGLARVGPVVLMAALPYVAGEGAKGTSVAQGGNWTRASVALLWGSLSLALALGLSYSAGLLVNWALILAAVTALCGRTFLKRAGGYTGDFLGATEQMLELFLLGGALIWLRVATF